MSAPVQSLQPSTIDATKTPWRVFTTQDGRKLVGIGSQEGEGILDCGFGVWAWDDAEGIANANLVVAAVNSHAALQARAEQAERAVDVQAKLLADTGRRAEEMEALISRPYIGAWSDEILIEAAHQRTRYGADHDHGKAPEDWFWLIGYLAGKALAAHKAGNAAKAHHHTVSTGAVLAHWAAAIDGNEEIFRPGLGVGKVAHLSSIPAMEAKP